MTKPLTQLETQWLCEAVRLREEQTGILEDSQACRQAIAQASTLQQRIALRALLLAQRDGLTQALQQWLQGARLASWLMILLALLTGIGLAKAALFDNTQVNIFWTIGCLLGLNFLSLILWSMNFTLSNNSTDSLAQLWLWLSGKLARDAKSLQLAPALLLLLQRHYALRWGIGRIIHGWWCLALLSSLITVLLLLSTKRYGFVWESTIIASDSFVWLVNTLGYLPSLLGFAVPSAELIAHSGQSIQIEETARHAWASWLVGALVIYGLLPRMLLWLICQWRWLHTTQHIQINPNLPTWLELAQRLMPSSERMGVIDQAPKKIIRSVSGVGNQNNYTNLIASIEIDPVRQWSVESAAAHNAGALDTREQRQLLLDQLSLTPVQRLLIICDPLRSVDRSTLNLIAELSHYAVQTRVWLLEAPSGYQLDADRLDDWQKSLDKLGIQNSTHSLLSWLEHGYDV